MLDSLWFSSAPLDSEYKKYVLLAYLQEVEKEFQQNKIYPHFNDIQFHLKNLESYRTTRNIINNKLRKISGVNFETMTFLYDLPDESKEIEEINKIVEYSEPEIRKTYNTAKDLLINVFNNINVFHIGIIPQYKKEGYLIVRRDEELVLYEYKYTDIIILDNDNIILDEVKTFKNTVSNTFESIKQYIIKNFNKYSNPSVLAADYKYEYPYFETMIPVIRTKLINKISIDI